MRCDSATISKVWPSAFLEVTPHWMKVLWNLTACTLLVAPGFSFIGLFTMGPSPTLLK
ncbi:hypothetical protein D3C71_1948080 [compost metagenome]